MVVVRRIDVLIPILLLMPMMMMTKKQHEFLKIFNEVWKKIYRWNK
jgi:hypothetical protein